MAEGGFDFDQNLSGSDSESEAEDDRMAREVREGLLMLSLDGEVGEESKICGNQSTGTAQQSEGVGTEESVNSSSSTTESSHSLSCPDLCESPRRSRSRSFSFGRLVRRLSRGRLNPKTRDECENTSNGRTRMRTGEHNSSEGTFRDVQDGSQDYTESHRTPRQRPRSFVLRPRSRTEGEFVERAQRRRSVSLFGKVKKFFDSEGTESDGDTGNSLEALRGSGSVDYRRSMFNPESPIRFPIGVNELVAIRRERARLRAEQTRIEYHIIPDLLEITNCPWYWGKINRFEAERVLEGHPDGTFLLRDSAQYHYLFSVSFRRYFRTYHARIEQWKHKYSFDKPSEYPSYFSRTVSQLLEHYSQAEQCMYYEPLLLHPLPRKSTLPLQHLCRAAVCSHVTFLAIDELPVPQSLKVYLREYHYKVAVKRMEDKGTQTTAPKRKFLSRS